MGQQNKKESSAEPIAVKQETGPKKKAKTAPFLKSNKRKIDNTHKADIYDETEINNTTCTTK